MLQGNPMQVLLTIPRKQSHTNTDKIYCERITMISGSFYIYLCTPLTGVR